MGIFGIQWPFLSLERFRVMICLGKKDLGMYNRKNKNVEHDRIHKNYTKKKIFLYTKLNYYCLWYTAIFWISVVNGKRMTFFFCPHLYHNVCPAMSEEIYIIYKSNNNIESFLWRNIRLCYQGNKLNEICVINLTCVK